MNEKRQEAARLLRALGHFYSRYGQHGRGLELLRLAEHLLPDDVGVQRSLVQALLLAGQPEGALAAIERLKQLEPAVPPALRLLESRALWMLGRAGQARRAFMDYVEQRGPP
ncbi:hypothetical protein AL346_06335 [Chelatococcus sp. CO-6]|nr:hypothetical protein AL346_06335 [Chelatococcus sp. CO-6]